MTENMKKFLEAASNDEKLQEKIKELKDNYLEGMLALAKDSGCQLTEADFFDPSENEVISGKELNEDELASVAGGKYLAGHSDCNCFLGGSGTSDQYQKTCVCVAAGAGELNDSGKQAAKEGKINYCGSSSAPVAMYCPFVGFGIAP